MDKRSFSAMVILILLALLAVIGIVATLVDTYRDGYRPVQTDWAQVAEHDALRDASTSISYR